MPWIAGVVSAGVRCDRDYNILGIYGSNNEGNDWETGVSFFFCSKEWISILLIFFSNDEHGERKNNKPKAI